MNEPDQQQNLSCPQINIRNNPASAKSGPGCISVAFFSAGAVFLVVGLVAMSIAVGILYLKSFVDKGVSEPPRFEETFVSGNPDAYDKIAIIPVEGLIHGGDLNDTDGSEADAFTIRKMLEQALDDDSVKAVVLWIDSPGGEVTASDYIYHTLRKFKAAKKPVVAAMGSVAASGGYYIAVGCDYIMAHPMTITGSIGVIMMNYKYYDLMKKIGVQSEPYTSGRFKDIGSGSRPTTEQEKAIIQQQINLVYDRFVEIIAAGRPKLTVQKIRDSKIGDGRIFNGEQAFKLGMVDSLGYLEDAIAIAAKKRDIPEQSYQAVSYSKHFSLGQILFSKAQAGKISTLNVNLPGNPQTRGFQLKQGIMYFLPAQ